MKKLEEELKLKIQLQLDADKKSSVEKAQEENTRRLLNFIYGLIIWVVSFTILSNSNIVYSTKRFLIY